MDLYMTELQDRDFVEQLKRDIRKGVVGTIAIRGNGLDESVAVGKLLDADPARLASSGIIPISIDLSDQREAFVTFGEYRFMKQDRLLDWLDMVIAGRFKHSKGIEPAMDCLPRLRRSERDR